MSLIGTSKNYLKQNVRLYYGCLENDMLILSQSK